MVTLLALFWDSSGVIFVIEDFRMYRTLELILLAEAIVVVDLTVVA